MNTQNQANQANQTEMQQRFVNALEKIRAAILRGLKSFPRTKDRENAIAEATALCWHWFAALAAKGKAPETFPGTLGTYAARAVWSGRKLCGSDRPHEPLSIRTHFREDLSVVSLPDAALQNSASLAEALADNSRTSVPEQVCFRLDFPAWKRQQTARNQLIIDCFLAGERPGKVANQMKVSPSRISQIRDELAESWFAWSGADQAGDELASSE